MLTIWLLCTARGARSYYLARQGDETGSHGGATSVSVEEDDNPLESADNGPLLGGPMI
jgi:hypothetical protein